jgi:branched-chain amino acid transport system substrate-binding protein
MKIKLFGMFLVALATAFAAAPPSWSGEPIYVGLSAPITGNYAEYGNNWKRAMDIAVERINNAGGIKGRPLQVVVEDSKGDPKEAAQIAQKFTSDSRIVAELGDFTSTACLAAQPIYDRAGMVQLSPTASHPDFAPKSPWSFGIVGTQAAEGPFMAGYTIEKLGKKKIAVLYINNDWGIAAQENFVKKAKELGAQIVAVESFFERDKDFTGVLTKLRGAKPDALYIPSMYNEGALISKQREKLGWNDVAVFGPGSLYSPKLLEIGGSAVEGLHTSTIFLENDPRPEVQEFVKTFKARNNNVSPNMFAAVAYDALNILAKAIDKAGTDRKAIRDELAKTRNFVGLTGKISFTERRDVERDYHYLIVKDGAWTLYGGK